MQDLRKHTVLGALLVVYLLSTVTMIGTYPRVWVDEPWESITAYTMATEGKLYNPILEGRAGWDRVFLEPRLLLSFCVAISFKLFGVGVVQGRGVSIIFGALLIVVGYWFGRRLISQRAGLLIAWLFTIETMIVIACRTVRPEIYLAAIALASMTLLIIGLQKKSLKNVFLSGLLTGITLWTHPNALLHVLGVAVLLLASFRHRIFMRKETWVVIAGSLIAFLPYVVYVIVNDASNGFANFWAQLAGRPEDIVQSGWLWQSLAGEWNRILIYTQFPDRLLIVVVLASALFWSLVRKDELTRSILWIIASYTVGSVILLSNKSIMYSSLILPYLLITLAIAIDWFLPQPFQFRLREGSHRIRIFMPLLVLVLFSANQIFGTAYLFWKNRNCSYFAAGEKLSAMIPTGSKIWGSMTFWYIFYDHPYRTQYTYLKELKMFKPDYVISGDTEVWGKEHFQSVRQGIEIMVNHQGELVGEIPGSCYGNLKVHRITW
jgi:4-amino-4-deoxy-L-arabinose transferase-like glycosyltransferase